MYCKTIFILVIDATLASDSFSSFRKNLLERIQKLIMKIDDKIINKNLQYDIHCHQAKLIKINFFQVNKYCLVIKDK